MGTLFAATSYGTAELVFAVLAPIIILTGWGYLWLVNRHWIANWNWKGVGLVVVIGLLLLFIIESEVQEAAHSRGETAQAHRDLEQLGFPVPQSLSVSDHSVTFENPGCAFRLRLEQVNGHYEVLVFKDGPPIDPLSLGLISEFCSLRS